jgi:hypothetical protein
MKRKLVPQMALNSRYELSQAPLPLAREFLASVDPFISPT